MKNVRSLDAVPKFSHELQSEHIYFKQGFGYEHLQKYLDQRSYIIDLWQDWMFKQSLWIVM